MKTKEFIYWWDTDTHYLGTVKWLAGVNLDIVGELGQQAKSATQLLAKDRIAVALRTLCRLRSSFMRGHITEEDILKKIDVAAKESHGLFQPSHKYSDAASALEEAIYFICPKLTERFPPHTNSEMIRMIFTPWPSKTRPVIPDNPKWKGGSACLTAGMVTAKDDAQFLSSVGCARWNNWPERTLGLREEGFGTADTNIVVDGENIRPGMLYAWIDEMLMKSAERGDGDVTQNIWFDIVCNEETSQVFDFILNDFGLPGEVHIDHQFIAGKSTVDFKMFSQIYRAHYQEGINEFVILSSDSDFWNLPTDLPDVRFRFVVDLSRRSGHAWSQVPIEFRKAFDFLDTSLADHNNFVFRVNYLACKGTGADPSVIVDQNKWDDWVDATWGYPIHRGRAAEYARVRAARYHRVSFRKEGVKNG